jgi:hypothetical protein
VFVAYADRPLSYLKRLEDFDFSAQPTVISRGECIIHCVREGEAYGLAHRISDRPFVSVSAAVGQSVFAAALAALVLPPSRKSSMLSKRCSDQSLASMQFHALASHDLTRQELPVLIVGVVVSGR